MKIGARETSEDIALIAEVGNNHEGSMSMARELIDSAFFHGADAVKLQTYIPDLYVSPRQEARLEALRKFCLPIEFTLGLIEEYSTKGKCVFTTPFDLISARRLTSAKLVKVSSGDITFVQLLQTCAELPGDLILSTGASTEAEVRSAVDTVRRARFGGRGDQSIAVLHCVSAYPAPPEAANLRCLHHMQGWFPDVTIGYSDHTLGIESSVVAAAAGARIVEKHFTLDKQFSSYRDHALSLEPFELQLLRDRLDEVNQLLGDGKKDVQESERDMRMQIRRSVTAVKDLAVGEVITEEGLSVLRPGTGVPPDCLQKIVGRRVLRHIQAGEAISDGDVA